MTQLYSAFTLFMSLLVEAWPFLLLGVLLSSSLRFLVREEWLLRWLPRNPLLGALTGSFAGFLFPACECGNVPVARRLLIQGAPSAVALGFLLAAPVVNPIVLWSTWTAFRDQPELVVLRLGFSLLIAIVIAWLFSRQTDLSQILQRSVMTARASLQPGLQEDQPALLQSGSFILGRGGQSLTAIAVEQAIAAEQQLPKSLAQRTRLFLDSSLQELRELGSVLILGSLLAAVIQTFIPREWVLSLGQGTISSILAMMLLAVIVSICSTVDSFFALAFAGSFTSGSLLAFLVLGPMVDLKAIGMLLSVFRTRAVVYLFLLAAQMTFVLCLAVNYWMS
jgi:uncharacterized membrane protein YraQ (UPF0718 family)